MAGDVRRVPVPVPVGRVPARRRLPWDGGDVVVYNLATQPVPGPSATLRAIRKAVGRALADAEARGGGVARVGVPRIGAGLGGLAWGDVEATLRAAGEASPVELVAVSRP